MQERSAPRHGGPEDDLHNFLIDIDRVENLAVIALSAVLKIGCSIHQQFETCC